MQFSQKDLIKIVCSSTTFNERLNKEFYPDEFQEDNDIVNSRLEQWCQVVAQGNWEKFEKRLAWDGLNLSTVRRVFGYVHLVDEQHLPKWAEILNEAIKASHLVSLEPSENEVTGENRCLDLQEPLPFEKVLLPFIYIARKKLIAQTRSHYHLLSEKAHARLEHRLLRRLTRLCSPTMELKFSIFRTCRQPALAHLLGQSTDNCIQSQYKDFIKSMLEGELLSFFKEYSVLARLVATATELWVDTFEEFIFRLASDYLEIQKAFLDKTELGQVVALETDLSDHHNSGRSVIALEFASGLKLLYKPKECIGLEQAYFKLLTWLNEQGVPLQFKILKTLNCSTYGWVEFVEHLPCQTKQEARQYYQRAGMLLCLIHTLAGTDCHFENIIACNEHPVLVDMETLMHPQIKKFETQDDVKGAIYIASEQLINSVIRTALLPQLHLGQSTQSFDATGLGGVEEQETLIRVPQWNNINTDNMVLNYEHIKMPLHANVPFLNGVKLKPNDYIQEIVDGFEQMYRFLMKYRTALLASDSPLTEFAHQRIRFVFRATQTYSSLLIKTTHPKFLRNGADRSIQLDVLCSNELSHDTQPLFWPLLKVEQQAMEQLDIPFFTASSDSNDLEFLANKKIENCFTESGYTLVTSRLNQLSEQDLEHQINFIRGSFYTRIDIEVRNFLPSVLKLDVVPSLNQEKMVQQATKIAVNIQKWAICSEVDNSAAWVAPHYIEKSQQRYRLEVLGFHLYGGCCGIALFLAALEKVTGGAGFRDLAIAAIQPLRQALQKSVLDEIAKAITIAQTNGGHHMQIGIGGLTGLASLIYALVRISQFLEAPVLLQDAERIASLFTPELISTDQKFDITNGSAGVILGLLALHKVSNSSEVLEQALVCGHHLLNHRVISNSGNRAWATSKGKKILTGLSHGAAGIAYSLLHLYQSTGETSFLEAANEAIAYEHSVFIPEMGNWPDLREISPEDVFTCQSSWCHGAPGIGLARVAGLDILDTDEIRADIQAAIKTTKLYMLSEVDDLCCGNLGRIEFLFTAARQLSQPQLLNIAMDKAAQVVARAEQRGTFSFSSNWENSPFLPGLFQGVAGIGYELLRLSYPDLIPSVLLLD